MLVRDQFIAEPFGHQFVPFATLATMAASVGRLRIGTLVLANDYWHRVVVAKEFATIDVLSGGWAEIGVGAGWASGEYTRLGVAFDGRRVRVDALKKQFKC